MKKITEYIILALLFSGAYSHAQSDVRGMRLQAVSKLVPTDAKPRFFFLGIGIDDYKNWKDLNTPVNDVKGLKDVLTERYHFSEENCVELYNEAATRGGIHKAFKRIINEASQEDSVLIYFAGHGQLKGNDGYWIPWEGDLDDELNWLSNDKIKTLIRNIECRNTFLISDSCFSGSFFSTTRGITFSHLKGQMKKLYIRDSRVAMSSGGLEPVQDKGVSDKHSVFARFLIRALRNNDRRFFVPESTEFYGYICDGVGNNLSENVVQEPQFGSLSQTGHADGSFVFFLKEEFCLDDPDDYLEPVVLVKKPISIPSEIPEVPVDAVSFVFSDPSDGILLMVGQQYDLSSPQTIFLKRGRHPFRIYLEGKSMIYGVMDVHVVNETTRTTRFGLGNTGKLFMSDQILHVLQGSSVKYSFRIRTEEGLLPVATYTLSLNPLK